MAGFEPRQTSAAFSVQSKRTRAVSPRAGAVSPNWANALAASALSSFDLLLKTASSTVPTR